MIDLIKNDLVNNTDCIAKNMYTVSTFLNVLRETLNLNVKKGWWIFKPVFLTRINIESKTLFHIELDVDTSLYNCKTLYFYIDVSDGFKIKLSRNSDIITYEKLEEILAIQFFIVFTP